VNKTAASDAQLAKCFTLI